MYGWVVCRSRRGVSVPNLRERPVSANDVRLNFVYSRMTWLTPPLLWFEIIVLILVCWCIYRFSRRRGSQIAALRDWLAYIAISFGLVAVIWVAAVYGPKESPVDAKWIAFAVNSVFVFGYTLKIVRALWTKPKLWAVFTGLGLLHGIIGWEVISRVERIPLLWYVPVDMAEIWAALVAIQLACRAVLPTADKPSR
jgi:hypothetical protein